MNAFLNIRWKLPSKVFGSLTITNGFTEPYYLSALLFWKILLDHYADCSEDRYNALSAPGMVSPWLFQHFKIPLPCHEDETALGSDGRYNVRS